MNRSRHISPNAILDAEPGGGVFDRDGIFLARGLVAVTMNYVVASPRTYGAGGAMDRAIDYDPAADGAMEPFARSPGRAGFGVFVNQPEGDFVLPIDEGIGN